MNLKDTYIEAAEKEKTPQLTEEQDLKTYDTAARVMAHFNMDMNTKTENLGHAMK